MALRKYDIPGVQFDPWTPPKPHGPRPLPANDAPPFRPRPRTPRPFGPKPPISPLRPAPGRIPGLLPGFIGGALLLPDLLDQWWPYPNPNPYYVPGPWELVWDCGRRFDAPPYTCGTCTPSTAFGPYQMTFNGLTPANSGFCIDGQAYGGAVPWGTPFVHNTGTQSLLLVARRRTAGGTVRYRNDALWHKQASTSGTTSPQLNPWTLSPFPPHFPGVNPNYERDMPGAPSPDLPMDPMPTPEAPFEWVWDSGPANSPRPRPRPSGKRPPPAGVKEGNKTRPRKTTSAFFEVMDAVSENSEVINGFYEALPKSVQDKWGCAKKKGRQFIDNAGQYGIDHVDCKLQALWHNWHQVDPGEAIMNVAKNLTEDQLYGLLHRHLPPGAMQAMPDDTGKAWNDWVQGALEIIFFGQ